MNWLELLAWIAGMWFIIRPLGMRWARPRGLSAREKARLTQGFEALGPERVATGLGATGHNWHDCFLALATAGVGRQPSWLARVRGYDRVPRVPSHATRALAGVWDRDERGFRDLAAAWLEDRSAVRPRLARTPAHSSQGGGSP